MAAGLLGNAAGIARVLAYARYELAWGVFLHTYVRMCVCHSMGVRVYVCMLVCVYVCMCECACLFTR